MRCSNWASPPPWNAPKFVKPTAQSRMSTRLSSGFTKRWGASASLSNW